MTKLAQWIIAAAVLFGALGCAVKTDGDSTTIKPAEVKVEEP